MKARILCMFLCLAVLAALVPAAVCAEWPVTKKVGNLTFEIYEYYCVLKECSADASGTITISGWEK